MQGGFYVNVVPMDNYMAIQTINRDRHDDGTTNSEERGRETHMKATLASRGRNSHLFNKLREDIHSADLQQTQSPGTSQAKYSVHKQLN